MQASHFTEIECQHGDRSTFDDDGNYYNDLGELEQEIRKDFLIQLILVNTYD